MALGTAFRAFFAALLNHDISKQLQLVLDQGPTTGAAALPGKASLAASSADVPPATKAPTRSDAVTLLATLQREARLIDLVKENLSAYSDAQIGAAARPCLLQCAATLQRVMTLKPIESAADGTTIDVPESASPSRYQWIGEGSGTSGKLVHHGWEVDQVELPQWTGTHTDAQVIAPVQVQRV